MTPKYRMILLDPDGKEVASRSFEFKFDGIGKDMPGRLSSAEEWACGKRACEMYRDAAFAVGKWPKRA